MEISTHIFSWYLSVLDNRDTLFVHPLAAIVGKPFGNFTENLNWTQ